MHKIVVGLNIFTVQHHVSIICCPFLKWTYRWYGLVMLFCSRFTNNPTPIATNRPLTLINSYWYFPTNAVGALLLFQYPSQLCSRSIDSEVTGQILTQLYPEIQTLLRLLPFQPELPPPYLLRIPRTIFGGTTTANDAMKKVQMRQILPKVCSLSVAPSQHC